MSGAATTPRHNPVIVALSNARTEGDTVVLDRDVWKRLVAHLVRAPECGQREAEADNDEGPDSWEAMRGDDEQKRYFARVRAGLDPLTGRAPIAATEASELIRLPPEDENVLRDNLWDLYEREPEPVALNLEAVVRGILTGWISDERGREVATEAIMVALGTAPAAERPERRKGERRTGQPGSWFQRRSGKDRRAPIATEASEPENDHHHQQQEHQTMTTNERIAGAIYDFAAYLTTRPGTLEVGSGHDAAPMVEAIKEWGEARGFETGGTADVNGWQKP